MKWPFFRSREESEYIKHWLSPSGQHSARDRAMNMSAQDPEWLRQKFTAPQAHNSGSDLPIGTTPADAWRLGYWQGVSFERDRAIFERDV